jgi:hypothetical protein
MDNKELLKIAQAHEKKLRELGNLLAKLGFDSEVERLKIHLIINKL